MTFGSSIDLDALDGTDGFRFLGQNGNDRFGKAVAMGDVNGDGFDDVLVGAHVSQPSGATVGSAYLLFGGASGPGASISANSLNGGNGFRIDGADTGFFGLQVAMGDINGDGFADIIVGSPYADNDAENFDTAGAVDVIFGGANLVSLDIADGAVDGTISVAQLDGSDGFRVVGGLNGNLHGGLAGGLNDSLEAGDYNGDGFDDVIVGFERYDNVGAAIVIFGKATGFAALSSTADLDGADGFRLKGQIANDYVGISVALSDVNGDGLDDAIVGARGTDDNGPSSGSAFVHFGRGFGFVSPNQSVASASGLSGFKITGATASRAGSAVVAGDFNGDGRRDLAVAAPLGGLSDEGVVQVYFGPTTPGRDLNIFDASGDDGFLIFGFGGSDRIGQELKVGDFNGDGVDDLVIGVETGDEYVVFGQRDGFDAALNVGALDGLNGLAVQTAGGPSDAVALGDFNGDGFDDLIVGNPYDDEAGVNAGVAKIVFGAAIAPIVRSGTPADDRLSGGAFSDRLDGLQGDDVIKGGAGDDVLLGGDDGDDLVGEAGDDRIEGGAGDDDITGGAGNDTLFGGSGRDEFNGLEGRDVIDGGSGDDTLNLGDVTLDVEANLVGGFARLTSGEFARLESIEDVIGGQGANTLTGDAFENILVGGDLGDTLFGRDGDDNLIGFDGDDVLQGEGGADDLTGGAGVDFLRGGAGDDQISGGAGDDSGQGDSGNEIFRGGDGADLFFGGAGDDDLSGDAGEDRLRGDAGNDDLQGGDGDDSLRGGAGEDQLFGNDGDDVLEGDDDNDAMFGGAGADRILGGAGGDMLQGEAGDDLLQGGDGDDVLTGGDGVDTLEGGDGDDKLFGGTDFDRLFGQGGVDTFFIVNNWGFDRIFDFEDGLERMDFSFHSTIDDIGDLTITAFNLGQDTRITNNANSADFIVLVGVQVADVDENDFIF